MISKNPRVQVTDENYKLSSQLHDKLRNHLIYLQQSLSVATYHHRWSSHHR